ncbi:MAG TPA: hypothetical protein VF749_05480, partial [Candidatus Acidoferrum sp.]
MMRLGRVRSDAFDGAARELWAGPRRAPEESGSFGNSARTRTKMIYEKKRPFVSDKEMEELRRELRASSREDHSWRLEALERILVKAQVDPATFRQFWIQPLLAAGLSFEVAVA